MLIVPLFFVNFYGKTDLAVQDNSYAVIVGLMYLRSLENCTCKVFHKCTGVCVWGMFLEKQNTVFSQVRLDFLVSSILCAYICGENLLYFSLDSFLLSERFNFPVSLLENDSDLWLRHCFLQEMFSFFFFLNSWHFLVVLA